jgi:hypothetical protein
LKRFGLVMSTQKYAIPLTAVGKAMYAQRDTDLERGLCFLIERIGTVEWARRRRATHDRYMKKLKATTTPDEGISVRDREDEIGWYLFLGETLIANPVAVDADQANRVAPYLSVFGRKLDAILSIGGVDALLDRLVRPVKDQDPDQVLFEIFVGAAYVLDGWSVEALPTQSSKTPDFEVKRGTRRFEVECKRLARRAGYSERERDSWLRLWKPVSQWLITEKRSLILSMTFHVEIHSLPVDYLLQKIKAITTELDSGRQHVEIGVISIHAVAVNYERIKQDLREAYVKVGSPRERFVVSGRYERDMGFTCAIGGRPVTIGPATMPETAIGIPLSL